MVNLVFRCIPLRKWSKIRCHKDRWSIEVWECITMQRFPNFFWASSYHAAHFFLEALKLNWRWWFSMFSAWLQTEAFRLSETARCNLCIFSERSFHFFSPSITAPSARFPNVEFRPFCQPEIFHLPLSYEKLANSDHRQMDKPFPQY